MSKSRQAANEQITEFKRVIAFAWERGRGNVWTLWFPGYTSEKGTFTAKGAKEENLTTDNTDWTDFHG
jgi:hypothetical protein